MSEVIKIGVSGFAEYATSAPSNRTPSKLRPFKFRNKGEGAGRSAYYKPALQAIRACHGAGNNGAIFRNVLNELAANLETITGYTPKDKLARTKLRQNIAAIEAYRSIYGERKFTVRRNHRLSCRVGPVTITAQPDLWVVEDGVEVLIKVGVAKKRVNLVDVMLYLIRKAAHACDYRVPARNVVYLDITNGVEICCDPKLSRYDRVLLSIAQEIATVWPTIGDRTVQPEVSA